jgi:two-component system chemotaxis sensor kinase CheA
VSIAESDSNNEFFAEFLDDYFAECDEHLTAVRRNLLALEGFIERPRVDRLLLDELFRSFHSLKGISGMVGVREAEQLAHEMESYLRALRDDQLTLSERGMDALMAGTKMLEQVVAERRAQIPASHIAPVMAELSAVLVDAPAPASTADKSAPAADSSLLRSLGAQERAQLQSALGNGLRIWRFEFSPTRELAERGINVNSIRARLQSLGELIHAAPRVMAGGGIAFDFLVATDAEEPAFTGWRDDGVSYSLLESPLEVAPTAPDIREHGEDVVPSAVSLVPSNVVRVDLGRLDDLMRVVGELVISRSRLDEGLKNFETTMPAQGWRKLQETNLSIERQIRELREGIMRVRLVPVGEIFERMQFVVRDLAREYDKKVRLEVNGQQTEIDKLLVERMMDPILHIVRNAISHGLEPAAERQALGKPPEGTIALRAFAVAETVVIEIEDDGAGIDRDRVIARARLAGLIESDAAVDDATLLELICAPGFSTREEADRASGRGVGMAVVKNTIAGLGGLLEMETEKGRGTHFTIRLPLTLAIADAFIITAGGQRFAVPQSSVREVIEIDTAAIKAFENNEIISYRGGILALVRLARLFQLDERAARSFQAIIIGTGASSVGIVVERILGQREIVVRAIKDPLIQVPGITGATELGDGRIVLILDAAALVRAASGATNGDGHRAEQ